MKTLILNKNNIYRGNLIFINKNNPIRISPEEIKKFLTNIDNNKNISLKLEPAKMLEKMIAICKANKHIKVIKGYITSEEKYDYNTGLALDIDSDNNKVLDKLKNIAADFGFIIETTDLLHFRYVGYPHSKIIKEQNCTLQDYLEFIKQYPMNGKHMLRKCKNYCIEIYFCKARDTLVPVSIPINGTYEISGNNMDGFVITIWRRINE